MADDSIIRVLYGKAREDALPALSEWVHTLLERCGNITSQTNAVGEWWIEFKDILKTVSNEEAEINARAMMTRLVDIVQGLLLMVDAQSDGDETARLVLESWFAEKQDGGSLRAQASRKEQAVSDLKIVFGVDGLQAARAKL